ncbi:MAG TPA: GNVR domain-containing protein [Terriglobia bacterium]|nr:GNVR domain-containing protein [Terriglobia bacterium]
MSGRRPLTGEDYLALLRRKWLLIIVPALLGPAIAYGISLKLHSRYTSESLMLIERQRVPDSYVKPVITEDLNARIADIEEQVLSRTRLQPIVERLGLFREEVGHATMEDLVIALRKAISLTPTKALVTSHDQSVTGFNIEVTLDDPQKAQQVCSEIASMFVEENIRQREGSAEGTANFLQSQLDDAKRKLDEQDARLAAFKRQHIGTLPDEMQSNLSLLTTLNTQLEGATQTLNRAQQDQAYAEAVLAQQVQAWEMTKPIKAGDGVAQDPNTLEKRLTELQNQLADMEARYSKRYPDLVPLRAEIESLKNRIRQQAEGPSKQKPSENAEAAKVLEPPQIQQLRAQAHGYEQAVQSDRLELEQLKKQIKAYESRLEIGPAVEQEYKEITRDHETALKFYNDLLNKRDESAMATNMEHRQEGERFRVLDPANLPEKPSFPKRPLFALGGFGIGLALGLGLAVAVEMNNKCLRTERDIEFYLRTPAFALIPFIESTKNGKAKGGGQPKLEEGVGLPLS